MTIIKLINTILIIMLLISCGNKTKPQPDGNRPNAGIVAPGEMIGIDVDKEKAIKNIIGEWELVKLSDFYKEFKLTKPSKLVLNKDNTYLFEIMLKDKGKLSYKGRYEVRVQNNIIFITFKRSHRAFNNDWKKAEATEIAVMRFLKDDLKEAVINIVNVAWHSPELKKGQNCKWKKIK